MKPLCKIAIINEESCIGKDAVEIFPEYFNISVFSKFEIIPAKDIFDAYLFIYPDQKKGIQDLALIRQLVTDCDFVAIWIVDRSNLDGQVFFDAGVTDLLLGHPSQWELKSRARLWIKALESRHGYRGLKIDQHQLTVTGPNGETARLTHKEIQILSTFIMGNNSKVSRNDILEFVWKGVVVGKKTLDVHIFNLRKKLAAVGIKITFHPPNEFELVMPNPSLESQSQSVQSA